MPRLLRITAPLLALLAGACDLVAYDLSAAGRGVPLAAAGDAGYADDGGSDPIDGADGGDANPCNRNNGGCSPDAVCTPGSPPSCACKSGFSGDGFTCNDVNECAAPGRGGCDANATCTNTAGAHKCRCKDGWDGDGAACTDVDECAQPTRGGCAAEAACVNKPGGSACVCPFGMTGDGFTCEPGRFLLVGALPGPRTLGAAALHGDHVIYAGGTENLAVVPKADVWTSRLHAGASPEPFQATTPLPAPRQRHCMAVVGDHVYVVGGATGQDWRTSLVSSVLHARVNADGSLGAWAESAPLPYAAEEPACASHGGRLYVFGGMTWPNIATRIVRADVLVGAPDATGRVGAWVPTTPLAMAHAGAGAAVLGGRLYMVGGNAQSSSNGALMQSGEVYFAPIGADGMAGAWVHTKFAGFNRDYLTGQLFAIGSRLVLASWELRWAEPAADGTISEWVVGEYPPENLSTMNHAAVAYGPWVYRLGGQRSNMPHGDVIMQPLP